MPSFDSQSKKPLAKKKDEIQKVSEILTGRINLTRNVLSLLYCNILKYTDHTGLLIHYIQIYGKI